MKLPLSTMSLVCWIGVVLWACLPCQSRAQTEVREKPDRGLAAEVSVTSGKKVFRVGEPIVVSYAIRNRGETPFYIPTSLEWAGPAGGFEVKVLAPKGARGIERGHGLVFIPPGAPQTTDIVREIEQKDIVLWPGAFYGREGEVPLKALSPGKYKIFVIYHGPGLTEQQMRSLKDLKYPLLLGTYTSPIIDVLVK